MDLDGDGSSKTSFSASQNDWNTLIFTGAVNGGGVIGYGTASGRTMVQMGSTSMPVTTYSLPYTPPMIVLPTQMDPELSL